LKGKKGGERILGTPKRKKRMSSLLCPLVYLRRGKERREEVRRRGRREEKREKEKT